MAIWVQVRSFPPLQIDDDYTVAIKSSFLFAVSFFLPAGIMNAIGHEISRAIRRILKKLLRVMSRMQNYIASHHDNKSWQNVLFTTYKHVFINFSSLSRIAFSFIANMIYAKNQGHKHDLIFCFYLVTESETTQSFIALVLPVVVRVASVRKKNIS
jgi:hypothetical protein